MSEENKLQRSGQPHKENEDRYHLLVENSRDIMMTHDMQGRITYVNQIWTKISGYSIEKTVGRSITELIPPEYLPDVKEHNIQRAEGDHTCYQYELEIIGAAGQRIPVEINSSPIVTQGKIQEILLVARDISKRVQTKQSLGESEERYRQLVELSPETIGVHVDGKVAFINQAGVKLFGAKNAEQLIGTPIIELIHPDYREMAMERAKQSILQGKPVPLAEEKFLRIDGTPVDVEVASRPITYMGKPAVQVFVRDMTERKLTEEKHKNILRSVRDAYFLIDIKGRFQEVNDAACKLTGYTEEELLTMSIRDIEDRTSLKERVKTIQSLIKSRGGQLETSLRGKNNNLIDVEFSITFSPAGSGNFVVFAHDITKRKQIEAAQKRQLNELTILQATAFTSTQAANEDDLIEQITAIIGNTLYPDNFGIMLLDKKKNTLLAHPSYRGVTDSERSSAPPLSEGITGHVASSGKPCRVGDVSASPNYIEFNPKMRSKLCVPIKIEGRVAGVINAESVKKDFFTEADERLLNTISGQMATVIQKFRLLETEKKRRQIAETLQKATGVVTTTLNQQKAVELILEQLSQVISFDSASVQLLHDDYLEIVGGRGALVLEKEMHRRFPFPSDNPNTIVIQRRRPLILKNAPEAYPAFLEMPSVQSWLGVPLIGHERAIGILTLDSSEIDHFSEEQAQLVGAFANQAAIAIENARLFEAEQKRRQEAETLRETALAITASLNLEEAIQHILEQLSHVLPYDSAGVQILGDGYVENFDGRGWPEGQGIKGMRFPVPGDNPNTRVIQERRVVILDNASEQHAPFRLPPHNYINSWMGVPLTIRDKIIGMLAVNSKEKGYFNEESAKIAQAFANQAAIAIENAQLFNAEQTRRQEAETLRQAAHTISSSLDLEEVFDTMLASLKRVIPYESAGVFLREGDKLRITDGYNLPNMETALGQTFPADDPLFIEIRDSTHPTIIQNVQTDSRFKKWAGTDYVRGWMGIPLITRGEVIGYITLDSRTENAYNEKQAELAQTFAHQAAAAIENARLFKSEQRRRQEAETLRQIAATISSSLEPKQVLDEILDSLQRVVPYDSAAIFLPVGKFLHLTNTRGFPNPEKLDGLEIPITDFLFQKTGNMQKSLIVPDTESDPHFVGYGNSDHIRSWMGVPLISRNEVIGFITLDNREKNVYTEDDASLALAFAYQVAGAIENARLFSQTEQRAKEFFELYQITQDLVGSQDLDTLLRTTLQRARTLLGVSFGDIYIYDEKSEKLDVVIVQGVSPDLESQIIGKRLKKGEGMAGYVAETFMPIRVDDYHSWEGKSDQYEGVPFTAMLEVPMLYAGNLIGVLGVAEIAPTTRHFTEAEERIMTLFATQVAGAAHSAKLFEETRNRLSELEAVNKISTALRVAQTPEEMVPILLDETLHSLNVSVGSIWLHDANNAELYRAVARGWIEEISPTRQKDDIGLIGYVFSTGESHIIEDFGKDSRVVSPNQANFPPEWNGAWVPIHTTNTPIGVLSIMAKAPRQFDQESLRLLTTMAEIAGNAIQRANLHERTEQQVKRLTALRNIDIAISSSFDLRVTLALLIDHAITQLGVDAADVLLFDTPAQTLTYVAGNGFRAPSFSQTRLRAGEDLAGKAILERKIKQVSRLSALSEEELGARSIRFKEEGFVSCLCAPLNAKGQIVGVLEIFNRSKLTPSPDWLDFLQTLAGQAAIAIDNNRLFENLKRSNQDLALAYDTTLEGWGQALELRDKETQGHTQRVTRMTLDLARAMDISDAELVHIYRGALLHDIGKMGIPDKILHNPGPLSKEEWEIMRQHPQFAYDLLFPISYLHPAIDIPYCHHEKWDGSGYPRGLKGEEIPIAARIFSIVDVWDALNSDRPYREENWPQEKIIEYIKKESGTRFDPAVVKAFLKMIGE